MTFNELLEEFLMNLTSVCVMVKKCKLWVIKRRVESDRVEKKGNEENVVLDKIVCVYKYIRCLI